MHTWEFTMIMFWFMMILSYLAEGWIADFYTAMSVVLISMTAVFAVIEWGE